MTFLAIVLSLALAGSAAGQQEPAGRGRGRGTPPQPQQKQGVEYFAGRLHKVNPEQTNNRDGSNQKNGGAHRTEPAPGGVQRVPEPVERPLLQTRLAGSRRAYIAFRWHPSGRRFFLWLLREGCHMLYLYFPLQRNLSIYA